MCHRSLGSIVEIPIGAVPVPAADAGKLRRAPDHGAAVHLAQMNVDVMGAHAELIFQDFSAFHAPAGVLRVGGHDYFAPFIAFGRGHHGAGGLERVLAVLRLFVVEIFRVGVVDEAGAEAGAAARVCRVVAAVGESLTDKMAAGGGGGWTGGRRNGRHGYG